MNKVITIIVAVIAIALTGCARMPTQTLAASHPGNPAAPEANYPSATPLLMAGTNLAMSFRTDNQQSTNVETAKQPSDKSKPHDEHNHNTPKK